jgi:hypothetical protein
MSQRPAPTAERLPYVAPTISRAGTVAAKTLGIPILWGEPLFGMIELLG